MKNIYIFILFLSSLVYGQEPAIVGEIVHKSVYEGKSIHATREVVLSPTFTATAGFEAKIVPLHQYDLHCSTPERDTTELKLLPWFDNNQYLDNLLDSLNYPLASNHPCPTCRIEPSSVIKYRIPVKLWVYRRSDGTGGPAEVDLRRAIDFVNQQHRDNRTGIRFYLKCSISEILDDSKLFVSNSESLFLSDWIGGRFDEGAINIHYILICLLNLATARGQIVSTAALAPQNSNRIYYRSGPVA